MLGKPPNPATAVPERVAVIGAGLMGSQIACEYALAGSEVVCTARDLSRARERVDAALALARESVLASPEDCDRARSRLLLAEPGASMSGVELVVESLPEDLALKAEVLRPLMETLPDATLATNTSSLRISDLGSSVRAPERTVGTHYWNPPMLMPLVEVVAGRETAADVLSRVVGYIRGVGKRPLIVRRDVPGFIWNRLQHALLREALWITSNDVASAADVDAAVRLGLGRRSRLTGPFETAALGGPEMFERVANNLFPDLSTKDRADGLADAIRERVTHLDLGSLRRARDAALAAEMRAEAERSAPSARAPKRVGESECGFSADAERS